VENPSESVVSRKLIAWRIWRISSSVIFMVNYLHNSRPFNTPSLWADIKIIPGLPEKPAAELRLSYPAPWDLPYERRLELPPWSGDAVTHPTV
jgi:hypothetical protein